MSISYDQINMYGWMSPKMPVNQCFWVSFYAELTDEGMTSDLVKSQESRARWPRNSWRFSERNTIRQLANCQSGRRACVPWRVNLWGFNLMHDKLWRNSEEGEGRYSFSWEPHLRATGRHLPYWITQCYLPPDTSEHAPPCRLVFDLPTP